MKALLFKPPYEIRLEVKGEEFHQGDTVPCNLSIKNRSTETIATPVPFLSLSHGQSKKIKAKDNDAFVDIDTQSSEVSGELTVDASSVLSHSFNLDKNCLLTEKAQSLYIRFGVEGNEEAQGDLQLNVIAHQDLEGIIGIFETSFQFLLKSVKSKKDWTVATYKAPEGPGYRAIQELQLKLHFDGDNVELIYAFKIERLDATSSALSVKKKKEEHPQTLARSDYMSSAGYVDPEKLEPLIKEILSKVTSKF
jgi:hypothetical protein